MEYAINRLWMIFDVFVEIHSVFRKLKSRYLVSIKLYYSIIIRSQFDTVYFFIIIYQLKNGIALYLKAMG